MPAYRVALEVTGTVVTVVEANDEDEACRLARHRAERGDADLAALEYQAVRAVQVTP